MSANPQQIGDLLLQSIDQELLTPKGHWVIPQQPHAGQALVMASEARYRWLCAHRRWGKNWACIFDALNRAQVLAEQPRRMLSPKVVVWFVFPTYILAGELWTDLHHLVPRSWVTRVLDSKPMLMELQGDIAISIRSADHPDDLVGAGIDLLYMVEAARMQEEAWLAIRPTLTSLGREGRVMFNSTPKGQNWFARLHDRCEDPQQPDWQGWQIPAFEPDLSTRHEWSIIPETERILEERAENRDRWFRQEYMADILSGEGQVFRDVRLHIALPPTAPVPPVVVGVDLAKRIDFSVFAGFDRHGRMLAVDRMQGIPYPQQGERLVGFIHRLGASQVVIETNGPGEAFIDQFKGQLHAAGVKCQVVETTTTAQAKEQMINSLALAFERPGAVSILDDPVLISEFEAYEARQLPSGREQFGAPEGHHDDFVMACALAWQQVAPTQAPRPSMPTPRSFPKLRKTSIVRGLGENPRRWYR
jgi:hypothetical protein